MNWLDLATAAGVDGFLHCNELDRLVELADGGIVLEIGSYRGLSAWGMAHTAKHVYCVDTFKACTNGQDQMPDFQTLAAFRQATARFDNVTAIIGTSEEAVSSPILRAEFDFIFIDAMHTFLGVKGDIQRWLPRVKAGGVLALHDYGHHDFPGVKEAADSLGLRPERVTITLAEFRA